MEDIKNWLANPDFETGVQLLEKHSQYPNLSRIMRRSGETPEHMETMKYELGKLVPDEEVFVHKIIFDPENWDSTEFRKLVGILDKKYTVVVAFTDGTELYRASMEKLESDINAADADNSWHEKIKKQLQDYPLKESDVFGMFTPDQQLFYDKYILGSPNSFDDPKLNQNESPEEIEGKKRVSLVLDQAALLSKTLFLPGMKK